MFGLSNKVDLFTVDLNGVEKYFIFVVLDAQELGLGLAELHIVFCAVD